MYNLSSIHFLSPSAHTIDGKRFDVELVVTHYPNNTDTAKFKAATAHILFDSEKGTNKTEEEPD